MSMLRKIRLGELLVSAGVITSADLRGALQIQKENPEKRLGNILIEMGIITQDGLINFLSKQLGIPYVDLSKFPLDADSLKVIPKRLVEEYKVVPLKKEGDRLVVAMVDPLDIIALDNISLATNCIVQPVVASEKDINWVIQQYYELGEASFLKDLKRASPPLASDLKIASVELPLDTLLDTLLERGYYLRARELHIEPTAKEVKVRYRIDGIIYDLTTLPFTACDAIINKIKTLIPNKMREGLFCSQGNFSYSIGDVNLEIGVVIFPTTLGEKIVLDFKNTFIPYRIDQLGFYPESLTELMEIVDHPSGLIIIAGPKDGGKTTTYYALLREMSFTHRTILSMEENIRCIIPNVNQLIIPTNFSKLSPERFLQEMDCSSFDIIGIDSIRDLARAKIAMSSALMGNLTFATLCAADAYTAITYLLELGVDPYLISSSLLAVVSCKLVRVLCPECKEPYTPEPDLLHRLDITSDKDITFYKAKGCKTCCHTGFKGRTALFEILRIKEGIRELISRKSPATTIALAAEHSGIYTMQEQGIRKIKEGQTTETELARVLPLEI